MGKCEQFNQLLERWTLVNRRWGIGIMRMRDELTCKGDSMKIANVTREGKKADYYIIPAGSMFPLGCAIPNHSVSAEVF